MDDRNRLVADDHSHFDEVDNRLVDDRNHPDEVDNRLVGVHNYFDEIDSHLHEVDILLGEADNLYHHYYYRNGDDYSCFGEVGNHLRAADIHPDEADNRLHATDIHPDVIDSYLLHHYYNEDVSIRLDEADNFHVTDSHYAGDVIAHLPAEDQLQSPRDGSHPLLNCCFCLYYKHV